MAAALAVSMLEEALVMGAGAGGWWLPGWARRGYAAGRKGGSQSQDVCCSTSNFALHDRADGRMSQFVVRHGAMI